MNNGVHINRGFCLRSYYVTPQDLMEFQQTHYAERLQSENRPKAKEFLKKELRCINNMTNKSVCRQRG